VEDPNVAWVNSSGNDTTGDGSPDKPYLTIQAAYAAVFVNFRLGAGTYTLSLTATVELNIRGQGFDQTFLSVTNNGGVTVLSDTGHESFRLTAVDSPAGTSLHGVSVDDISTTKAAAGQTAGSVGLFGPLTVYGTITAEGTAAAGGSGGNGGNGGDIYVWNAVDVSGGLSAIINTGGAGDGAGTPGTTGIFFIKGAVNIPNGVYDDVVITGNARIAGDYGASLIFGAGGTLGSAAYTAVTAYLPAAGDASARIQLANLRLTPSTVTYAGTTNLDLDSNGYQTVTLAGNITFTTSNRAAGRSLTLRIIGDGSIRNLTFPAWVFMGAAPTTLAAGKTALLTIESFGTADADIVASYAVEP